MRSWLRWNERISGARGACSRLLLLSRCGSLGQSFYTRPIACRSDFNSPTRRRGMRQCQRDAAYGSLASALPHNIF